MSIATSSLWAPASAGATRPPANWPLSVAVYFLFALTVFAVQGSQPLLGPDHVTYIQQADEILEKYPAGDYWRATDSVHSFGVMLAYMHGWTGSHVLSMRLILIPVTVVYVAAAEALFALFSRRRWESMLFAMVSAFAVSFGFASWGVTDSTALMPRTLAAPVVLFSTWIWLRYWDRPFKYVVFPLLIAASVLHLSTFYAIGVFGLLEIWDLAWNRRFRIDARVWAFIASVLVALSLLYTLERIGVSVRVLSSIVPHIFGAKQFAVRTLPPSPQPSVPRAGAPHRPSEHAAGQKAPDAGPPLPHARGTKLATARDAWALELSLRPWRNMPMRLVTFANVMSSYAVILLIATFGIVMARRTGFTPVDRFMLEMFVAVPVFAFLPQTVLWILRSFTNIYPTSIEEVRAISLLMIPSLYFAFRLFQSIIAHGSRTGVMQAGAVVAGVLVLPLAVKSIPHTGRELILSGMIELGMVDSSNSAAVTAARAALGISNSTQTRAFFYPAQKAVEWARANLPSAARILTDRDEFILLRHHEIIGPMQVAAVPPRAGVELPAMAEVGLETRKALATGDFEEVRNLAVRFGADYMVVPWPVRRALYADEYYSIVAVGNDRGG